MSDLYAVFLLDCFQDFLHAGPTLSQLDQLLPVGQRAGLICSRLFKFTQQHTACFTENNWVPYFLRPTLLACIMLTYCV